jgi:hypothetical protein
MSALGHKQTYAVQKGMSALPSKADMCGALTHVRFVPIADIGLVEVYKQPRGWLAPDVYQPQRRRPADPDPYARWSTCRNNLRASVAPFTPDFE